MDRRAFWLVGLALLAVGCAVAAPDAAGRRPGSGAARQTPAAVSGSGAHATANADRPLLLPAPGGSAVAAGSGGAGGASQAPPGCVVGQFCAPQTPDPTDCGTLTLDQDIEVKRSPGNLLLIFDQSLSMAEPWGLNIKIEAAKTAISNAVTPFLDALTIGALFFPTYDCMPNPPPNGAVAPIDGPGQIPFQPGKQFMQAWSDHWLSLPLGAGVGTPMQEAFDRAEAAIGAAKLTGPLVVIAVTDGQPNCFPQAGLGAPTAKETERVSAWLAGRAVKTYVVGLPGAAGVTLLDNVAVSGGTMGYLLPDDPKVLEDKLREVVNETVKTSFESCTIKLTPAADPPEKLQMTVVETRDQKKSRVDHMLGPNAGWTISVDGTQVEIFGQLCVDAKAGRFSAITFEYPCKDTPPPPKLPPPMLL